MAPSQTCCIPTSWLPWLAVYMAVCLVPSVLSLNCPICKQYAVNGTNTTLPLLAAKIPVPPYSDVNASAPRSFGLLETPDGTTDNAYVYVALGDSFSAGNGARRTEDNYGCRQAENGISWPKQLAGWLGLLGTSSWTHAACSGYTIDHVWAQLQDQQLSQQLARARLVTITVGGNDLRFADIVKECFQIKNPEDCFALVKAACDKLWDRNQFQGRLITLYRRIAQMAPRASIIVAGYPDIVPYYICPSSWGLTDCEYIDMKSLVDPLARIIMNAVWAANENIGRITFVDVRAQFSCHEPCSRDCEEYINGFCFFDFKYGSFHPNRDGQCAYSNLVWNALTGKWPTYCPLLSVEGEANIPEEAQS